jgi:hypothetical protein
VAGADPEDLPPLAGKEFWASSWSSDGQMLAGVGRNIVHAQLGPAAAGAAILYSFMEGKYIPIVETIEHYPVWFRDSRRVLVQGKNAFQVIDIRTRTVHRVLSPAGDGRFSLSPDNRTLYYGIETSEADIWLMSLK